MLADEMLSVARLRFQRIARNIEKNCDEPTSQDGVNGNGAIHEDENESDSENESEEHARQRILKQREEEQRRRELEEQERQGTYDDETGDNLDYFANLLTNQNAKDIIIACGFIKEKTFLFSDLDYVGTMYPNIVRIWKAVTNNTVSGIFGFDGSSNIGKTAFPAIQAAPSFPSSFPQVLGTECKSSNMACLIPCAIDQDPYFRMTRDIAHKLVPKSHPLGGKPALIHSKFFPPLQGAEGKMSSSDDNSAVFLTDDADKIKEKIKQHAFSGGQKTKEEQEKFGANLDIDVPYQWLRFFLEDDEELKEIGNDYSTGSGTYWSTAIVKARLIEVLKEIVDQHQRKREKVTDAIVREWMEERRLTLE